MTRIDIINHLISKYSFSKYLEIGLRNPDDCFNHIQCANKKSVDPGYEYLDNPADYKLTSDDFFKQLKSNQLDIPPFFVWDVIFVDALHISYQVDKDIENSLSHLADGGIIVLHDCNPPTLDMAREDFNNSAWNGTVWKAIYKYKCTRPDLEICTVDDDYGVSIIRKGKQPLIKNFNEYYEYRVFEQHRKASLNLIDPSEFDAWLNNPFFNL